MSISNRLLQDWLQSARDRGHELKPLLHAAGIPWRHYERASSQVSGIQLARLTTQIRCALDDLSMGYGRETMSPALLDRALIKILAHARTLRHILHEWETFWNLVQRSTGLVEIGFTTREVVYRYAFNAPQPPGAYVWILCSTMFKLQLFSWMIGRQIKPKAIGVAGLAPRGVDGDLALLPAQISFGQPRNFFAFDRAYLDSPVVRTPEECLDYRRYMPDDFFAVPHAQLCFARSVEQAMQKILTTEFRMPSVDAIAEELSVSVRQLSRRLQAQGESFQGLKHKIRRELATQKLARLEIPVADIAADLGFSGTAAFSRVFKTWTQQTPQEYRVRHAAAASQDDR